jgi:hypothetical protein
MLLTSKGVLGLALGLLLWAPEARAGVIFTDNFNSGPSPLWGNEVGAWTAAGGVYNASLPTRAQPYPYTSIPFDLTAFSFQVDINQVADGGIWLRSQDNRSVPSGNNRNAAPGITFPRSR